jgi:hypothetical protein
MEHIKCGKRQNETIAKQAHYPNSPESGKRIGTYEEYTEKPAIA